MFELFAAGVPRRDSGTSAGSQLRASRINLIVAIYEIAGGLIGICVMIWLRSVSPASLPWGSFTTAVSPFGLVVAAGIALLLRQPAGLALSVIVQTAQVIFWSSAASVWKLSAGLVASVWVIDGNLHSLLGYDFTLLVGGGDISQPHVAGANFFALVVVIVLVRVNRSSHRRQ